MPDRIRQWFVDHADGDFSIPPAGWEFSCLPPSAAGGGIVYTTKPRPLLGARQPTFNDPVEGLIGRYGLPSESDLAWLAPLLADRRALFVGDADPADLLVFAWLRSRIEIAYRGVSDALLERCCVM